MSVQEVGYQSFLRDNVNDIDMEPADMVQSEGPFRARNRANSRPSRHSRDGRSSRGSVRSQLSRIRQQLELEQTQMLHEHRLQEEQAKINLEIRMARNRHSIARLELERYESDEEQESIDGLLDLNPAATPEEQTASWAERHFLQLSLSNRQQSFIPTTTQRVRPPPRPLPLELGGETLVTSTAQRPRPSVNDAAIQAESRSDNVNVMALQAESQSENVNVTALKAEVDRWKSVARQAESQSDNVNVNVMALQAEVERWKSAAIQAESQSDNLNVTALQAEVERWKSVARQAKSQSAIVNVNVTALQAEVEKWKSVARQAELVNVQASEAEKRKMTALQAQIELLNSKATRAKMENEQANQTEVENVMALQAELRRERARQDELENIQVRQAISEDIRTRQATMENTSLPPLKIIPFNGEKEKYLQFMATFEIQVEGKTTDPALRLQHLLQATTGNAHALIEKCIMQSGTGGYREAKERLELRYGNSVEIARAMLDSISDRPVLTGTKKDEVLDFVQNLKDIQQTLEKINMRLDADSPERLARIMKKLPRHWKVNLMRTIGDRMPTFNDLIKVAEREAVQARNPFFDDIWTTSAPPPPRKEKHERRFEEDFSFNSRGVGLTDEEDFSFNSRGAGPAEGGRTRLDCYFCEKGQHPPWNCEKFENMTVEDRVKATVKIKLCFNCFSPKHRAEECPREFNCRNKDCKDKLPHNTLLHPLPKFEKKEKRTGIVNNAEQGDKDEPSSEPESSGVGHATTAHDHNQSRSGSQSYIQAVPVRIMDGKLEKSVTTYAMIDTGSDTHILDIRILRRLEIQGQKSELRLKSACTAQKLKTETASIIVQSYDGRGPRICLPSVRGVDAPTFIQTPLPTIAELSQPEIVDLRLHEMKPEIPVISMIIGTKADDSCFINTDHRRTSRGITFVKGSLGWSWLGGGGTDQQSPSVVTTSVDDDSMKERLMRAMFEIEKTGPVCGTEVGWSQDDKKAMDIMESTTKLVHDHDGPHYQMAIPWKRFPPKLEDNKFVALRCLQSLKTRFKKDPAYFQLYAKQMSDYERKGYSSRVTEENPPVGSENRNYLTHHGVINEKKPGKVRVVFNCAKSFNNKTMNQCIYSGPDLTKNLREVLLRWRALEVVVIGDVEEMYHRVRNDPRDHTFLRYVWWPENDMTQEPVEFFMKVHLFGCISSGTCANAALQKTARDNEADHSIEVKNAIFEDFYVDDFAKSFESPQKAISITNEMITLLKKGGFALKKLTSNCKEVLYTIPEELRHPKAEEDQKVLGLSWNSAKDTIILELEPAVRSLDKRGLLGICMSLFDPLGLICIITFQIRVALQDLCRKKMDWDELIPEDDEMLPKIMKLLENLKNLHGMELPRCIQPKSVKIVNTQVHHFGDASFLGYSSCTFLRCVTENGEVYVTLISAKSRVAPLKALTIVRLEFLAARTMAREQHTIDQAMPKELERDQTFFWTDSQIVLKCINNDSRRFRIYAANILSEIHEVSSPEQWRHVTSKDNPADDATRLIDLSKFTANSRWFRGPTFLYKKQSEWDQNQDSIPDQMSLTTEESKLVLTNEKESGRCTNSVEVQDENVFVNKFIKHFSALSRLVTSAAWMMRFVKVWIDQEAADEFEPDLSIHERRKALHALIRTCQADIYSEEFETLRIKGTISKQSSLYKLGIIQKDGLLCLRGRLGLSDLSVKTKHPIILPQKHHVTTLIIDEIHKSHGHQGVQYVIAESRMKYWIIHANAAVKRVLLNCIPCKRYNARPCEQQMAELPADRVTEPPGPFERTGVDLFGPFYVKIGRSIHKRYAALFTDLVYRGVHIEILHSLSTDSFVLSLQRFCDRRGAVKVIRSDRGSNFTSSDKEIREATLALKNRTISKALQNRNIEWILNPGKASHFGGVWERLIRSCRSILNHLIGRKTLTDESLLTMMTAAETILNNRPLEAASSDPKDLSPITPNHLLQVKGGEGIQFELNVGNSVLVNKFKFVQKLKKLFWRRFLKEYLLTLNVRSKWLKIRTNLKVGDLVILVDDNHRSEWKLGRVLELKKGRDGLVRSVSLKTNTASKITRPITKVCFLENTTFEEPENDN